MPRVTKLPIDINLSETASLSENPSRRSTRKSQASQPDELNEDLQSMQSSLPASTASTNVLTVNQLCDTTDSDDDIIMLSDAPDLNEEYDDSISSIHFHWDPVWKTLDSFRVQIQKKDYPIAHAVNIQVDDQIIVAFGCSNKLMAQSVSFVNGHWMKLDWSARPSQQYAMVSNAQAGMAYAVMPEGRLVLVGGVTAQRQWIEFTRIIGLSQRKLSLNQIFPGPAIAGATLTAMNAEDLILFGGVNPQNQLQNSVHLLSSVTGVMEFMVTHGHVFPEPRVSHTACLWKKNEKDHYLVIYGGTTASTRLDDLWLLHLGTMTWKRQHTKNNPEARGGHSSLILDERVMVVFGGWVRSGEVSNDLAILDLNSMQWLYWSADDESWPEKRAAHGMVFHNMELVLLCGYNADGDAMSSVSRLDVRTLLKPRVPRFIDVSQLTRGAYVEVFQDAQWHYARVLYILLDSNDSLPNSVTSSPASQKSTHSRRTKTLDIPTARPAVLVYFEGWRRTEDAWITDMQQIRYTDMWQRAFCLRNNKRTKDAVQMGKDYNLSDRELGLIN